MISPLPNPPAPKIQRLEQRSWPGIFGDTEGVFSVWWLQNSNRDSVGAAFSRERHLELPGTAVPQQERFFPFLPEGFSLFPMLLPQIPKEIGPRIAPVPKGMALGISGISQSQREQPQSKRNGSRVRPVPKEMGAGITQSQRKQDQGYPKGMGPGISGTAQLQSEWPQSQR